MTTPDPATPTRPEQAMLDLWDRIATGIEDLVAHAGQMAQHLQHAAGITAPAPAPADQADTPPQAAEEPAQDAQDAPTGPPVDSLP